ncbi:PLDc N-terminal domain-containing protein [Sphingobacterium sp. SYP-B4668]|uniref:PLDc N-terminal domain-containing protein n=1 Tax=Sphingobacterium sp. SYP-B4668 TaxID=2996035 RepID=UPI0022DDA203|nr:PLDc N-terminal domain-containing protein [Sphingobacterium sp. SYP-B4668]
MNLSIAGIGTQELIVVLPIMIIYFYCLFHAATNREIPGMHRLIWFFVILSVPLLGGIAYWFIGRGADKPRFKM